ncbi:MAG: sigma-70 family RNA polymerase sigma factor [OM182 bacterium]
MAEAKTHKIDSKADLSRWARYEKLVASLYQDVYRYGFWLCKSQPLAEDLVQETFLRAWRSLDSLKNDNAAKARLFTILRRENARLYERYRPVLVDVDEQVIVEKDSIEPDNKMERRWLLDAMNRLEKDYREPLLLQIIGGFSGKEIALILDINSNTVMTRLLGRAAKSSISLRRSRASSLRNYSKLNNGCQITHAAMGYFAKKSANETK